VFTSKLIKLNSAYIFVIKQILPQITAATPSVENT